MIRTITSTNIRVMDKGCNATGTADTPFNSQPDILNYLLLLVNFLHTPPASLSLASALIKSEMVSGWILVYQVGI